jgi:hypothetical protein
MKKDFNNPSYNSPGEAVMSVDWPRKALAGKPIGGRVGSKMQTTVRYRPGKQQTRTGPPKRKH